MKLSEECRFFRKFLNFKTKYNFNEIVCHHIVVRWDARAWRSYGMFTGFQVVLCAVLEHLHLFIHWVNAHFAFSCFRALPGHSPLSGFSEKLLKEGSSFLWDAMLHAWASGCSNLKSSPLRLEHYFVFCSSYRPFVPLIEFAIFLDCIVSLFLCCEPSSRWW